LFDLDGTVIDSSAGIQGAFNYAYEKMFSINCPVDVRHYIGPPLPEMIKKVIPAISNEDISIFINFFKESYDTVEFSNCTLYPGIEDVFKLLQKNGVSLFIITNKRNLPTQLILQHLNIDHYFLAHSYSLDSLEPAFTHKKELVTYVLEKHGLNHDKTVLVGDGFNDKVAAEKNNISFIFAAYGFEKMTNCIDVVSLPLEIINYFK
jgi:phosphoglycolate phosphatase